jgi:hypothetical protein
MRPEHGAERLLDAQMCPREIRAQHGLPVFELHAEGKRIASDCRVVDQNVQTAEFRQGLLEAGFDLERIGNVHRDDERFAARLCDLGRKCVELFGVARGDGDFCAARGERQRDGTPDSLRCAGDQRDPILQ